VLETGLDLVASTIAGSMIVRLIGQTRVSCPYRTPLSSSRCALTLDGQLVAFSHVDFEWSSFAFRAIPPRRTLVIAAQMFIGGLESRGPGRFRAKAPANPIHLS